MTSTSQPQTSQPQTSQPQTSQPQTSRQLREDSPFTRDIHAFAGRIPAVDVPSCSSQLAAQFSQPRFCRVLRSVLAIVIFLCGVAANPAWGQAMSVSELMSKEDQWEQWRLNGTKLLITGRYEGRTAQIFRMERIPFSFEPPLNSPLPERMRSGQRIEVSGRLLNRTGRLMFEINRLSVNGTDLDMIRERQQLIDPADFRAMFALASEFETQAEFYADQPLRQEIEALREVAVQTERRHLKGQVNKLRELAARIQTLKLNPRLSRTIQFEAIVTEWKQPKPDIAAVLRQVEENLGGWNQPTQGQPPVDDQTFLKNPVAAYDKADDAQRQYLHRRLYRILLLGTLQDQLNDDGSNGLQVAALVRERLPEETQVVQQMEERELNYRLGRVSTLSRAELEQLTALLETAGRSAEISQTVDEWLRAQENRYRSSGLAGLLRTADEFLFVANQWNRPEHREAGTSLLKQAWSLANEQSAKDADSIAERLRSLGWERLKGQWMTTTQIASLPKDDVQVAMREGRVVRGMTAEQVVGTLGQPARISRIISSRIIRELWIYDNQGSTGVVVQFQRSRKEASREARVSSISTSSGR